MVSLCVAALTKLCKMCPQSAGNLPSRQKECSREYEKLCRWMNLYDWVLSISEYMHPCTCVCIILPHACKIDSIDIFTKFVQATCLMLGQNGWLVLDMMMAQPQCFFANHGDQRSVVMIPALYGWLDHTQWIIAKQQQWCDQNGGKKRVIHMQQTTCGVIYTMLFWCIYNAILNELN